MSIRIDAAKLVADDDDDSINDDVKRSLVVVDDDDKKSYECYLQSSKFYYLPFAFARRRGFERERNVSCFAYAMQFNGTLRPQQVSVVESAKRLLEKNDCVIVKSYPGFGKTICAINIMCDLKLKCLILVNRTLIMSEWIKSIREFTTRRDALAVTSFDPQKTDSVDHCDVCVANAINVTKRHINFWSSFDMLIVDEFHQLLTPKLIRALLFIRPLKLIGLSATPFRYDAFNACVSLFFGDESVGAELNRAHKVYVHHTKFTPNVRKTYPGAKYIDWNEVLRSLSSSEERNRLIAHIITDVYPRDRVWMILVKRIDHAHALKKIFDKSDMTATTLLGNAKTFDENAQILIGTTSKIGTGFNHKRIDSLLVASDVQNYFVQFLGRCMRTPDVKPIVVDLVDDFGPLKKHFYNHRRVEYLNSGGILEELKL